MACWARLYDGERALSIFKKNLKEQSLPQLFSLCYTAMQVDGSFGNAAAIGEMLIQSHEGFINLLPALPGEWASGKISGIKARGGFEVSLEWKNRNLISARVYSSAGGKLRIKCGNLSVYQEGKKLKLIKISNGITEFETVSGKTYNLITAKTKP